MDANKTYLATKLDPILEPLVTELLLNKPSDPIEFMIKWLENKQKKNKSDGKQVPPAKKSDAPAVVVEPPKASDKDEQKDEVI